MAPATTAAASAVLEMSFANMFFPSLIAAEEYASRQIRPAPH
jgi:hypothetical protein